MSSSERGKTYAKQLFAYAMKLFFIVHSPKCGALGKDQNRMIFIL